MEGRGETGPVEERSVTRAGASTADGWLGAAFPRGPWAGHGLGQTGPVEERSAAPAALYFQWLETNSSVSGRPPCRIR